MSKNLTFSCNPVVSIVGRSNVGKSALFNKIVGKRVSVVHDSLGVTRDRVCSEFEWRGRNFTLVDTGGLEFDTNDSIKSMIEEQVKFAISSSNLVLFVVDYKSGLMNLDKEIAFLLRKSSKNIIVCVNKCDNIRDLDSIGEFYSLGFDDLIAISSVHGHGTGDLLDLICEKIPEKEQNFNTKDYISVSIIGKPNVGKSSIINRLCGEQRSIVADFSGTTRDSVDTMLEFNGTNYLIVDTAGIRRKNNLKSNIEKYSTFRALDSVERSDVCLVVIDASEGITSQDAKIAGISKNYNKSCIILVNKWDKLESNTQNVIDFEEKIRENFKFASYAPIIYISAKTGRNFDKIIPTINKVYGSFSRRVPTGILNSFLEDAIFRTPTPSIKGKQLKIYYMTQTGVKPPTFVFFVNKSKLFHFSYQRYIEKGLRNSFEFGGTPLRFVIRQKGDSFEDEHSIEKIY